MDCSCINYLSNIQKELNSLFNAYLNSRLISSVSQSDSGTINPRLEMPQRDYFTLNNVLYFIMIVLALFSLISIGMNRAKKGKSTLK